MGACSIAHASSYPELQAEQCAVFTMMGCLLLTTPNPCPCEIVLAQSQRLLHVLCGRTAYLYFCRCVHYLRACSCVSHHPWPSMPTLKLGRPARAGLARCAHHPVLWLHCRLPMFAFALACALWDHSPLLRQLYKPCRSTSLTEVLDGLCLPFQMLTFSDHIATPCRHNDLIKDLHAARQERDRAQQELDGTKEELQASEERNIVLSEKLGVAQDSQRATERSRDDYRAQMQQVGLPLCSAVQCWAGSIGVASKFALPGKCSGAASGGAAAPVKVCFIGRLQLGWGWGADSSAAGPGCRQGAVLCGA